MWFLVSDAVQLKQSAQDFCRALKRWLGIRFCRGGFFSVVAGWCVLLFSAHGFATVLTDMRLWEGDGITRVVFEFDKKPHFTQFTLQAPDRLVLDIQKASVAKRLPTQQKGQNLIREIRVAQKNTGDSRVVLELSQRRSAKVFYAAPAGENSHRIVIEYSSPAQNLDDVVASLDKATLPNKAITSDNKKVRPIVVVIDPGHGGEDPGAIGPKGTREKTIVLTISKRLAQALNAHPGVKAVLTRDGDVFIPLKTRREIAVRHKADLFVSIHADAAHRKSASGASVFALSHGGKESHLGRMLAAQANQSDLIGGIAPEYTDPELKSLLYRLAMESNMTQSLQLGSRVLSRMGRHTELHKSSVEQAGFAVLKNPNIPSILVETGFISNPKEERALLSATHQAKLAESIKSGVVDYFQRNPLPNTWFAQHFNSGSMNAGSKSGVTSKDGRHKVAAGDTLSAIAHRYSLSIRALKRANNLKTDRLHVGQVLTIPNG